MGRGRTVLPFKYYTGLHDWRGKNVAANALRARCGQIQNPASMIHFLLYLDLHLTFYEQGPLLAIPDKWNGKDVKATSRGFAVPFWPVKRNKSTWTIMSLDGACRLCHAAQKEKLENDTQIAVHLLSKIYIIWPSKILAEQKWSSREFPEKYQRNLSECQVSQKVGVILPTPKSNKID